MTDPLSSYATSRSSPAGKYFSVTPDNNNDLSQFPKAFYIGGAGTLVLTDLDGNDTTFTVFAGTVLPVRAKRVKSTGTTATLIVALCG